MAFIFMTSDPLFFKGHSKIQFTVNSLEARKLFKGFNVWFIYYSTIEFNISSSYIDIKDF